MQSGTKTAESKCENSAGSSAAEKGSARFEVGNEDGKNRARQTAIQFQFGKTEPDESPIWNGLRLRAAGEFKRESKAWLKQMHQFHCIGRQKCSRGLATEDNTSMLTRA